MLYRAKDTVCSEIHTKHTNALCAENAELLQVKPDVNEKHQPDAVNKYIFHLCSVSETQRLNISEIYTY